MKKRIVSCILALTLAVSLLCTFATTADAATNLLTDGDMSAVHTLNYWGADEGVSLAWMDAKGASGGNGFVAFYNRPETYRGAYINLGKELEGKYKVTFMARCVSGEKQEIRYGVREQTLATATITDTWAEVSGTFTATKGTGIKFSVLGGMKVGVDNKTIFVDDVVIEPLDGAAEVKISPKRGGNPKTFTDETVLKAAVKEEPVITVPLSGKNILTNGSFDSAADFKNWVSDSSQKTELILDGKGADNSKGYVKFSNILINYKGFTYKLPSVQKDGTYRFSCYVKTADKGSVSQIRFFFYNTGSTSSHLTVFANVTDEWMKVETYVTVKTGMDLDSIRVCGGPFEEFIQPYCIDEMSLVQVDPKEVPATVVTTFGKEVTKEQAATSWTPPAKEMYDPEKEAQYKVNGLIINQDADGFIRTCNDGTATVESLKNYAYQFKGSHITDYMICVNNTNATYDSEVWTSLLDKYHQKEENGIAVDYSNHDIALGAYYVYEKLGVDYIDLWCDVFNEIGINPWISFRMNDAHDLTLQTSVLLSDFFHEHAEVRRVQHHSNVAYYDYCRDYGQKEARDYMLALIEESLNRYDMYGIELDFQREIWLFKIGGEYAGIEIMNQFMRDVNKLVEAAEKKHGHDIKVAVRVASDIQTNMDFGLNVMQWVQEGLVQMVTPTGRWSTIDADMPILTWATLLAPYEDVELCAGIENNIKDSSHHHTYETLNGYAANFYSQGADKIYLFNQMRTHDKGNTITEDEKVYVGTYDGGDSGYWEKITTLGSAEKVMNLPRRVILTYNDTQPIWKTVNETKQYPRSVTTSGITYFRIPVGDIPEGSKVAVKFSASTNLKGSFLTVHANSEKCTFLQEEACVGGYTENMLYSFEVPEAAWSGYLTVEIQSRIQTFNIDHVEVTVMPADAE